MPSSHITGQTRAQVPASPQERNQTLKHGQIVYGKISRLMPNQTAEVQIGNRTHVVKLDAVFSEGEARWLQITNDGREISVKPVGNQTPGESTRQTVTALLQSLQLTDNKELRQLLTSMFENKWPVTAEKVTAAASFLTAAGNKTEALSVLKWMASKDLPFKAPVFQAASSANEAARSPVTALVNQLTEALQSSDRPALSRTLQTIDAPYQKAVSEQFVQRLLERTVDSQHPQKNQAVEVLKNLGVLIEKGAGTPVLNGLTLPSHGTGNAQSPDVQANRLWQGLMALQKEFQALPAAKPEQLQQIHQALSLVSGTPVSSAGNQQAAQLFIQVQSTLQQIKPGAPLLTVQHLIPQMPDSVMPLVRQLLPEGAVTAGQPPAVTVALAESQSLLGTQGSSHSFMHVLKQLIQATGIDYEARLLNQTLPPEKAAEALKPQLLSLIADSTQPASVRESAETLVSRLNGMQLFSTDNGPMQQLLMQFPMHLGNQQSDVIMQWSGRKKATGQLDPDFARVLFYITLKELKESVIDMNVQNRVITLDIYNEHNGLDELAEPLVPVLKDALNQMGYQLSSVKFHVAGEVDPPIISPAEDVLLTGYHKVDYKA
ncbi:hypothetical protein [Jeotgalibacillus aurantiacus]|uniref:hypothetical protein n=1 Tax=Jeotgalibacillus aurantiacus TaxID=2763266 RepID=UPI001D09E93F|nr:hypothetical protein [Jeotgalibacillus aurantiacus]